MRRRAGPLPIERAHYDAWVQRIEETLDLAYPKTAWFVFSLADLIWLPGPASVPPYFRVVAVSRDGGWRVIARVPCVPVVDETMFARVVVALGHEMERRLAEAARE